MQEITLTDSMCREKKEEEDSSVMNIASMHQYKDSKATYKREESWRLEETCCHSDSNERPSANLLSYYCIQTNYCKQTKMQ